MILLLSGAFHKDAPQNDLNRSLGGLISSTPLPNNRINSLFGEISNYTIKNKQSEIVAFFIKNNTANDLSNLSIQEIYEDDNLCEFDFAIATVTDTGAMELIGSRFEEPFYANWFEPTDKTLIKETFAAGEILGVWVRRRFKDGLDFTTEDCELLSESEKDMEECLEVIFSHD